MFLKVLLYCARHQHCPFGFARSICHDLRDCGWKIALQESSSVDAVGSVAFFKPFFIESELIMEVIANSFFLRLKMMI
jgi:hypothetical protein